MNEPDWKRYKPLRKLAIDRFCHGVLKDAAAITASIEGSAHEQYRELYQLMKKRDKDIVELFDPHTRSRATMQLIGLFQMRLVTEDELTVFSDDLQEQVRSYIEQFGHSDSAPGKCVSQADEE